MRMTPTSGCAFRQHSRRNPVIDPSTDPIHVAHRQPRHRQQRGAGAGVRVDRRHRHRRRLGQRLRPPSSVFPPGLTAVTGRPEPMSARDGPGGQLGVVPGPDQGRSTVWSVSSPSAAPGCDSGPESVDRIMFVIRPDRELTGNFVRSAAVSPGWAQWVPARVPGGQQGRQGVLRVLRRRAPMGDHPGMPGRPARGHQAGCRIGGFQHAR